MNHFIQVASFVFLATLNHFNVSAQSPIAGFTTIPSSTNGNLIICVGEPVGFVDLSQDTGPLVSYDWQFGLGASPGFSSDTGPIIVTYGMPVGNVLATLTVDNNNGFPPSVFTLNIEVLASPTSDLLLLQTDEAYASEMVGSVPTFRRCNSDESQLFSFLSNHPNTVQQNFDWGDGSPDSSQDDLIDSSIDHVYPIGEFWLEHTVTLSNGCSILRTYRVFNGSAPIVTVSGSGQNTCTPSDYQLEVLANNVPIDYIVSYSDITFIESFSTSNDTTLTHTFVENSCGEEYIISPILPPLQNAYSATLVASNLCSANGIPTVVTIGPITVSSAPDPEISMEPFNPVCISDVVTLTSTGEPGQNVTIDGCNDSTLVYWSIEESTGYVLESGTIGASNGASGEDYSFGEWTPGSESIELGFDAPGLYHAWLHTGNACGEDSVQQVIAVIPFGTVTPSSVETTICSGDTVNPITWNSSQPGYLITWLANPDAGLNGVIPFAGIGLGPLESPDDWILVNEGDEPLYVEIEAGVSCMANPASLWTIEVLPVAVISIGDIDLPICSNEPFEVEIEGNVEGMGFGWVPTPPLFVTGASAGVGSPLNDELVNTSTEVQTVTYTVFTPDMQCPALPVTVEIDVLPLVVIPPLPDVSICSNEEVSIDDYDSGIDGVQWSWENSNVDVGLPETGNGYVPDWLASLNDTGEAIESTIVVSAQLADCPAVDMTFNVTLNPMPEASLSVSPNSGLDCLDLTASIDASTGAENPDFQWTGPGVVSQSGSSVLVNESGGYTLILIDGITGCSAEFEVEVLPPTPINILATGAESPNCNGGNDGWIEVLTDAGNEAVYTWSLPGVDDAYVDGLSAGTYSVLVTNASNCADSATVILTDFPVLTVDLVEMTPSECGESNGSLVVSGGGGQGGYGFSWTLFQNNSTLDGVDEGNYDVEVTDAGGCTVQGTFPVDCYPLTPIIVNQLITPNDDGFNDVWIIENLFMYPDNKVQIFNRWGTEVFEADPYENDWTGFWDRAIGSNKLLPAGTYYYLIDTRKKSQKPYRGFIELQHEER